MKSTSFPYKSKILWWISMIVIVFCRSAIITSISVAGPERRGCQAEEKTITCVYLSERIYSTLHPAASKSFYLLAGAHTSLSLSLRTEQTETSNRVNRQTVRSFSYYSIRERAHKCTASTSWQTCVFIHRRETPVECERWVFTSSMGRHKKAHLNFVYRLACGLVIA